eukprot:jgi/Tetstr1/464349/TSEL_009144.t2
MRTQLSLPVQFGGLGIGDNVSIADASHFGAAALVVGQAVTFLRAQHATLSDAGAFFSDPSGVSSPQSLYLVGASSIHQALATPTLELDASANASAPMWAIELRAAHTRVVNECGDAVLEDLAGPLASALKLLPSKRSHVARAGCSDAGAEPASALRSAADLQAIPHYSDFPLHSMRKVQETLSHRIHTVRFAKLAARMPRSGPDSNRFRGRLLRAATAFLVTDPPCMLARFEDAGVEFTPSTWAVAYADHVARCSGGDSNHAAHEWAAHGLSDICHDVKSALGVGVQILTEPSVLVSLPKGSDGRPADVGLFGYGGIRGNTVAVDTTIAPILGVSTPDPTTALRAAERHKIQKYDEGVRNAAGMLRFVPFAVSEFGSLAPHAEAFLELAELGGQLRVSATSQWVPAPSIVPGEAEPSEECSGWEAAPEEVLLRVFTCLEWHPEGSRAAGATRLVCARWQRLLTEERRSLFPRSRRDAMPRDWVARFPSLQALDMRSCTNTRDSWLPALACLRLTFLNLQGSDFLTAHGLRALLPLSTSLASLDLTDCHRVDDTALGVLAQLAALQSLGLAGCRNITDTGVAVLAALPALTALDASRCRRLTDATPAALSCCTLLTSLRLERVPQLTDAGLWHMRGLTALHTLSLSSCPSVTHEGLAYLPPSLRALLLRGCVKLDDTCLEGTTVIAGAGNLTALEISGCPITDAGAYALPRRFPRLADLQLMQCASITDAGLHHLQHLPGPLTALNIGYCAGITAEGLEAVLLTHGAQLMSLSVRGCEQLGDAAMAVIGAHAIRLTALDCSSLSNMTDAGAASLTALLHLRSLGMQYCPGVGDIAVKRLLAALPELRQLSADRICDNNLRKATGDRPQLRRG